MNDRAIDSLYQAVIEATEEAVINSMLAAETTIGRDGNTLHALPVDRTLELLRGAGRLQET
jgi:D-aminopeptidase